MKKEILHRATDLLPRHEHYYKALWQKLRKKDLNLNDVPPALTYLIEKNYLSDQRFAASVLRVRADRGFGWFYIKNELNQKGGWLTIIKELNKNHEIDWHLQAELAYNKRFNMMLNRCFSYEEPQTLPLKDKAYQLTTKEKAKRIRFCNTGVFA